MHSSRSRTPVALLAIAAVAFSIAAPVAARADGAADAASAGVGVARISLIQGAVAVQRGDSATPLAAAINAPVLGADYVTTGDGARAEIQFDGSSSVRLGSDVQMRFTHLDTANRELQLAAGTIDLRLLRGTDGRSQIDTPTISIRPRATGSYRVSVDSAGRTQVTVRSGSADIVTSQGTQQLGIGTTLLAQGAAASPSLQSADALAYDDFDRFNRERDDREERALANAYTAPAVAGIDDLDAYGRWVDDSAYGRVWVPSSVGSTWAPYRDGRWVWEEGYGWTWLGYEPWGWAPYHYGRWYHSSLYGWCWYPERAYVAWRPAVVAFLSFGSGFGFGFGNIGWVPLAPYEPYYAWWGNRYGYGNNVTYVTNNYYGNVNNVTIVKNGDHDRNRHFGNMRWNGATSVSQERFAKGDFDHLRAVDRSKERSVRPFRGVVPVMPTEENLRFSNRPVAAHLAVAPALTGGTFAGNDIAVRRMPFAQQRETLAGVVKPRAIAPAQQPATARIPVTTGTTTTMVPVNATGRAATAARAVNTTPANTASTASAANAAPAVVNDPWARFGASRGTPVTHTTTSANAAAVRGAATMRGDTGAATRNAPDAEAWRHADTTRPSGAASREATSARSGDAPVRRTTTAQESPRTVQESPRTVQAPPRSVQEPPRSYSAPRETREYSAPRQQQQSAPPPPAAQQRSAPPPHTERAPATKSTTPH